MTMNRRHFIKHTAAASAMLVPGLRFFSQLQAAETTLKKNNRALVIIHSGGGQSTTDFWNAEVAGHANAGETKFADTKVPGIRINELMPKIAKVMDKLSIIQTLNTQDGDHMGGTRNVYLGIKSRQEQALGVRSPSFASAAASFLVGPKSLTPFVAFGGAGAQFGSGFLHSMFAPITTQPGQPPANMVPPVDARRMAIRGGLLEVVNRNFAFGQYPDLRSEDKLKETGSAAYNHMAMSRQAVEVSRGLGQAAFTLGPDEAKYTAQYGNSQLGRGLQMARKLIQSGVANVIEVETGGGWDMHGNIFPALAQRMPGIDQAISAFVEDMSQRGLFDSTVMLTTTEFNRTLRINQNAGRDHYPRVTQVLIGGGGIKGGVMVGKTTDDGAAPKDDPVSIPQMFATVYTALLGKTFLTDINNDAHDNLGRRRKWADDGSGENAAALSKLV